MAQDQTGADVDPLLEDLPPRYIVGIDLGTTNSAVTYIDTSQENWEIKVFPVPQLVAPGQVEPLETLPSSYYQPPKASDQSAGSLKLPWDKKNANFCVGKYARDETAKTSGRGISSAKSWLSHSTIDRTAAILPWHSASDVARLSPVEVSGQILRHIRKAWEHQFKDHPLAEQDIVLTLPASFDEIARELTVQAASKAGLDRVFLIEEPQAAFYAWVYKNQSSWQSIVSPGQKILVCDIGGGTTDFTLIRVRKSEAGDPDKSASNEAGAQEVQFHRVAVGNHLILGGDNLDLAIAKHLEQKISGGDSLDAHSWDVLVGSSRGLKEQMLAESPPKQSTVLLPSRGSKLIGSSSSVEATDQEIRSLIIDGFLPAVDLTEKPISQASGFQEFGLPYATDPAITKYLADFLTTHATAGEDQANANNTDSSAPTLQQIRPDIVLFNGGFFASPVLRQTVVDRITKWFNKEEPDWKPQVLENDRLDLAVARGAAYYGIVRRDQGVKINASLARSYYIGVGNNQAICVMPGKACPGDHFRLDEQKFHLTISQPVEFSLFVSSTRLADAPGQIVEIDATQMKALPPIRTIMRAKSRNEKRDVEVVLESDLTEIGTVELSCHQTDEDRSWKLQFDIRSATQTELEAVQTSGETQGILDDATWEECSTAIEGVFSSEGSSQPNELVQEICLAADLEKDQWPMTLLRRVWQKLMELQEGRRKKANYEARWLNLLGYSLRPGYGVALDDWRVSETWRHLQGKLAHNSPNVRNEARILWRRIAGGLTKGQQSSLAQPLISSIAALASNFEGKKKKGNASPLKPEDAVEAWRLLGSLEWLSAGQKFELCEFILKYKDRPKLAPVSGAMMWALGRIASREPMYGPLNCVVHFSTVEQWLGELIAEKEPSVVQQLSVVQMARKTDDRYRDIGQSIRSKVVLWLKKTEANPSWIRLVEEGGQFDQQSQGQVFGEALPAGLKLVL